MHTRLRVLLQRADEAAAARMFRLQYEYDMIKGRDEHLCRETKLKLLAVHGNSYITIQYESSHIYHVMFAS